MKSKVVSFEDLEAKYQWFHISSRNVGPRLKFKAKVPGNVYVDRVGNPIEDFFTPRVCFSDKIHLCKQAKYCGSDPDDTMTLYVPRKDVELLKVNLNPPKSGRSNRYGPNFSWEEYCNAHGINYDYYEAHNVKDVGPRDVLAKCVPDGNRNHEHWSLKNIEVVRIGKVHATRRRVTLN